MKIDMRIKMAVSAVGAFVLASALDAQGVAGVRFEVLIQNNVSYSTDSTAFTNYATAQQRTSPTTGGLNFGSYITIADVVSVNGKPAKGVKTSRGNDLRLSNNPTTPPNGRAISDVNGRLSQEQQTFEILQIDNTAVGSLMLQGYYAGPAPPGNPVAWGGISNFAIIGGTGAFLGARGFCTQFRATNTPYVGSASVAEDPLKRREYGGDDYLTRCNLIPMLVPEIVNVFHEDFTPVTTAKPAAAGEVLITAVRGLGPTRPGVEPGTPFPQSPLEVVNSPIEMTAGGQAVEVMNPVGWPGQENLYRVDFHMPKVAGPATALLQLTAAWIPGPAFSIPVP